MTGVEFPISKLAASSDEELIHKCRAGDAEAWAALIDRYKNLIYSIPVKMGLQQDAPDIFQAVCLDLLAELQRLREPKALPKWLIQVTYHKCLASRHEAEETEDTTARSVPEAVDEDSAPEEMLLELQREQAVRAAIATLPERCARLVTMLFFEENPRPYDEIARELNLATGSIGFIRGRCLTRLRKQLVKMGWQ